ncbi:MAG: integrase [Candidatus Gribaldobacteria bacterium]|nr:integrase [Candidatus Gribaldobacteria bacterium]
MTITMNDSHTYTVAQIQAFSKLDSAIKFQSVSKKEKYEWINDVLTKFKYFSLRKKDKGVIRNYIAKMTGLSQSQTSRIINKKRKFGKIFLNTSARHRFPKKYSSSDIALLVKTDNSHARLSGPATKTILEREHRIFNKTAYSNVSQISVAHLYNLRATRQYQSHCLTIEKTQSNKAPIGERKKPEPESRPGFLRVDSVHQGDYGKQKGVYHINITDETTQWEIVGAVEKISELCFEILLKDLIDQFPFKIINFHSDNGSEYINKVVAQLLNKLLIQQTKSRARHCNDNALAECKNGAVVRKHMGYVHIPRQFAPAINQFYKQYFNVYLNYHRPCGFATIIKDKKGKEKKAYRQKDYKIPYEKLKSLDNAEQYLRDRLSFKQLDKIAYEMSDNDFAEKMQKAKEELFKNFKHRPQEMMVFTSFISHAFVD